jgi:hypothetical protein
VAQLLGTAFAQLPATLAVAAVAVLLFGLRPRPPSSGPGPRVGLAVAIELFGQVLQVSHWVLDVSPFTHTPRLPDGTVMAAPLLWLCLAALAFTATGLAALRRRDISQGRIRPARRRLMGNRPRTPGPRRPRQAEPRRIGPLQLLQGECHLGERLLKAGNPPVPDRPEPVPGGDRLGFEDPERLGRCGMPDGCGERGAVRLARRGEGRSAADGRRRCDAGRVGRVPHSHGGGVGDRHLRERVGGRQPDRPLAAEQGRPQQPAVGVGLATLPLRGGTRRRVAPPVEFALEDLELAVEQVGAAPGDR